MKRLVPALSKMVMVLMLLVSCSSGGGSSSPETSVNNSTGTGGNSATYTISGQVTLSGSGLSGVVMTLSGASTALGTTDASGNYSLTGLANGSYTVTPLQTGYTFTPASKAVTVNSANVTAQNFTTTAGSSSSSWSLLKLPDTGQTTHYSTAFGDDANYTINPPSYTDNGDGTITDNVTTLIWQKRDDGTTRTWDAAGTYCTGLSLGGHADWRLPNVIELMSIVDYGRYAPFINITYFTIPISGGWGNAGWPFWSTNMNANYASPAWVVYFYRGNIQYGSIIGQSNYVRCVRGGQ